MPLHSSTFVNNACAHHTQNSLTMTCFCFPILGDDYPDSSRDVIDFFANFVTLLIVVIASLFAGDAIVSEYQQRTGYLLFPNPVKRVTLYSGKLLAAVAMSTLVLGVYYGGAAIISLALTGDLIAETGASFGLALLYTAAAISFIANCQNASTSHGNGCRLRA